MARKTVLKEDWKDNLEYFLLFKRSQGVSERTLSDYQYHIQRFFTFTKTDSLGDFSVLKLAVMKYFAESSKLSPVTFNTRRKTLKPLFSWAIEEGFLEKNPMDGIRKMKEDNTPRSVQEEVIKKLLSLPDLKTYSGVRDYALLLLTMDTGIRPSEAYGLKLENYNPRAFEITIPAYIAKTRISRTLPISPVTIQAIQRLISVRHQEWRDTVPIFCTADGTILNRCTWARRLRQYKEIIKDTTKLNVDTLKPYALRHTFAVMFLRHGGNAFALQKSLGHANLTMTKRYVALTQSDLRQQHAIASPLNTLVVNRLRKRKINEKG